MNTKASNDKKRVMKFLVDWAAVLALFLCIIVFSMISGSNCSEPPALT